MDVNLALEMARALYASNGIAGHYDLPDEDPTAVSIATNLRASIWERDNGRCHICGRTIDWAWYECGHIVDRSHGGINHPSNLVVMCRPCNQVKPGHATRAEYNAWIDSGAWMTAVLSGMEANGMPWSPELFKAII